MMEWDWRMLTFDICHACPECNKGVQKALALLKLAVYFFSLVGSFLMGSKGIHEIVMCFQGSNTSINK